MRQQTSAHLKTVHNLVLFRSNAVDVTAVSIKWFEIYKITNRKFDDLHCCLHTYIIFSQCDSFRYKVHQVRCAF